MDIILKSKHYKVTKIKKKTTAHMFKDLKVGDTFSMYIEVEKVGLGTRGTTYAPEIKIKNHQTGEVAWKTFNQIGKVLERFEFEEV